MKEAETKENKLISLPFIVNGMETVVEKVNINQPLKVSVEKALLQSGNASRPISDWQVKYNDIELDTGKKVGDFNFSSDPKLFISLKAGIGGK